MSLSYAVPVFPTQDMNATLAFYLGKLGFHLLFNYGDYAGVRRDHFELHFWVCADRVIAENTSCRVKSTHLDLLYHEYQAAGVLHPNGALHTRPEGQRQFTILDPAGNIVHFYE